MALQTQPRSPAFLHQTGHASPQSQPVGQALGFALGVWLFWYEPSYLISPTDGSLWASPQCQPGTAFLSIPHSSPRRALQGLIHRWKDRGPKPLCRAHWLFSGLELAEGHDTRKGKFTMNSHGRCDEQVVSWGANANVKDLSLLSVALSQVCL